MSLTLENLPPELFRYILTYLSPEETSALAQTSHQMKRVTRDDKIWQQYFLTRYTYTVCKPQYSNEEYLSDSVLKLTKPPNDCTWQEYFIQRSFQDQHIRLLLNEIMSTRKNRIYNAKLIVSTYGLLAIDVLKRYLPSFRNTSTSLLLDSRNLTREYYSLELTRLISREIGLQLLDEMENRTDMHTEGKALINGLFVVQCFHPYGIFLSLKRFHSIGKRLVDDPVFPSLTVNEKCQLILSTMKAENFCAANNGEGYYNLENSFLFSTFNGKPTIPLTLVSIFCALAEECGLIARPLSFPGEVMAQVDQSSISQNTSENLSPLIISVFDSKILSLDEMNNRLVNILDRPLTHPLPITPITEFVIRSARNMVNSITQGSTSLLNSYGLYAALAVLKILGDGPLPFTSSSMLNVLKEHFPMDLHFFQRLYSNLTIMNESLQQIQEQDLNPLPIEEKRRNNESCPKYYIGQIFQHLLYNYWGVICGWDLTCMASSLWQTNMGISNLTRGATQPFYHILADDFSQRYVAEDNIDALAFASIENEEQKNLIVQKLCSADEIGKQFERVDMINGKFIPNIELRNEYPDDFV
ncbi:unnamed protein product [Adineta steineri]|uniref:F-box domain-containing protein n=1 Tax=Adineta steineri TaxID=433720 RepID=A0A819D054_9BILA|nr:unnamed protein product [Adineta steineri]